MPKSHVPFGPNGEQQIKHNSPSWVKAWSVGHKSSPIFSYTTMTYSQSNLRCVAQSTFLISCIFGKLLENISYILGHDGKPCDQNLPSSQYSTRIFMNFVSICVTWYAAKIHASCMLFESYKVAFTNTSTSFRYYSFMLIEVWLYGSMSSIEFRHSFFHLTSLYECLFQCLLLIVSFLF